MPTMVTPADVTYSFADGPAFAINMKASQTASQHKDESLHSKRKQRGQS